MNFLFSGDLYIPNGCACISIHTDTPVWLRAVFCRNLVEYLYTNTTYYNTLSNLPSCPISVDLYIPNGRACISIHTDTPVWLRAVFCRNLVEFLYTNTIYYNTLSTLPKWISFLISSLHTIKQTPQTELENHVWTMETISILLCVSLLS